MTVCPACDVPPPRGSTLTPSSRAIAIARSASAIVRGTTTPSGIILIVRGVGGVAAAVEAVKQHVADDARLSAGVQGPGRRYGHGDFRRLVDVPNCALRQFRYVCDLLRKCNEISAPNLSCDLPSKVT